MVLSRNPYGMRDGHASGRWRLAFLFRPERPHRIDPDGAEGRDQDGAARHGRQHGHERDEHLGAGHANARHEVPEDPVEGEGEPQSDHEADGGEPGEARQPCPAWRPPAGAGNRA